MTACPASEKLKGLGPQSFRKGSLVISSINKPDHYIVSSLHVFEYTFVCDSAPIAHRRLTIILVNREDDDYRRIYNTLEKNPSRIFETINLRYYSSYYNILFYRDYL